MLVTLINSFIFAFIFCNKFLEEKIMKNRITLLVVLLLLSSVLVFAKEEFTVFASKGELTVQKSGKGKWEKLITGNKLNPNDNIKVGTSAYLSLIHASGKTVEIKQSGVYSVNKLSVAVKNKQATLSARITNFIMNEIKSSDDLLAKGNYHEDMGVTGAVERGLSTESVTDREAVSNGKPIGIRLNSPPKANIMADKVKCSWLPIENAKMYNFVLTDRFDKPVYNQQVEGTSLELDPKQLNLDPDVYYFWAVNSISTGKKSDKACFLVMSKDKIKSLNDTISMLKAEMETENAVNQFVMGNFYEQNNLIEEANICFKKALELEPEVKEYSNIYKLFKIRNNVSN